MLNISVSRTDSGERVYVYLTVGIDKSALLDNSVSPDQVQRAVDDLIGYTVANERNRLTPAAKVPSVGPVGSLRGQYEI